MYSWVAILHRITIFITVFLLSNGYLAYPYPLPRLNDTHGQDDMHTLDRRLSIRHSLTLAPRATLEVIWSCLATTISCTWVAIHPNIPFVDHPDRGLGLRMTTNRVLYRLFLMLQALLFPEVIVTWAYRQHLASGEMSRGVNDALASSSSSSELLHMPLYIEEWRGDLVLYACT